METVPANFFGEIEEVVPVEELVEARERGKKMRLSDKMERSTETSSKRVHPYSSSSVKRVVREPEINALTKQMAQLTISDKGGERTKEKTMRRREEPEESDWREERRVHYEMTPRDYSFYKTKRDEESEDSDSYERVYYRPRLYESVPRRYYRHPSPPSPRFRRSRK